ARGERGVHFNFLAVHLAQPGLVAAPQLHLLRFAVHHYVVGHVLAISNQQSASYSRCRAAVIASLPLAEVFGHPQWRNLAAGPSSVANLNRWLGHSLVVLTGGVHPNPCRYVPQ